VKSARDGDQATGEEPVTTEAEQERADEPSATIVQRERVEEELRVNERAGTGSKRKQDVEQTQKVKEQSLFYKRAKPTGEDSSKE